MTETDQPRDYAKALLAYLEQPSEASHYEALGRFIAAFADAESAVHMLARNLSGLSDDKARVIFGGLRLSDVTDRIKQFISMDDVLLIDQATILDCLTQLTNISDRRHRVVHRGASWNQKTLVVTNTFTARSRTSIEVEEISEETLTAMTNDCRMIFLRLAYIATRDSYTPDKDVSGIVRNYAWQYKHVPPKPPGQKPRKDRGSHKPQPQASGE